MEGRSPKSPVAWLFGRQLIASLKQTALYAAFGEKLDPKDWMRPEVFSFAEGFSGDDFWFDYIADSGDGQTATYSIAYLAMSDLFVEGQEPQAGAPVRLTRGDGASFRLPRGRFLFVGGDTAYHIADERTLRVRFQEPFRWAHEDLEAEGRSLRIERLFGIPGNHDYYDSIDGFNRVFRRPFNDEDEVNNLAIPGFRRTQEASYVALELPFGWWFAGVDSQSGWIDKRQEHFFTEEVGIASRKKLVMATPEPSTVFGRRRSPDSEISNTFARLGLTRPFLESGEELPSDHCRLDLSGDVHHYARYWGPDRHEPASSAPSKPNYASLVAGLGGAFLHSSETDFEEVPEQEVYPPPYQSRTATARRLCNPWKIARGGYVWLIGAIAAAILYFGAGVSDSSRWLFLAGEGEPGWGLNWLYGEVFDLGGPQPAILGHSLFFFATLVLSFLLVRWAAKLRDAIHKAATAPATLGYALIALCWVGALGLPYLGLWWCGRHSAAIVASDLGFLAVLFLYLVGLPLAGWKVAGARHGTAGKAGFALLGLGHGVLQLFVPYLLASRPHWLVPLIAAALVPLSAWLTYQMAKRKRRPALVGVFLAHGALQLALPLILGSESNADLLGIFGAATAGAVMSCVFFGQYLAVALAFNGHNNEAGGAARIERFKQLLRIRLREEGGESILSVYVVAVDDPVMPGRELRPKVVDFFELRSRA